MISAVEMILAGETSGAWPVGIELQGLLTEVSGLQAAEHKAVVGRYLQHKPRVLGVVGGRYRATTPREWRDLITAAVEAGAKPTGAFSLRGGSRVLATFEVGESNGIKTFLLLADSFDGSTHLTCGFTSVRVVCANTLAVSSRQDGAEAAKLRHTASLEEKVKVLTDTIGDAIRQGQAVKDAYDRAEKTYLSKEQAKEVFNRLFPEAADDASKRAKTRADNQRCDARKAAAAAVNRVGEQRGNLATLWNAATYLVDRQANGKARKARGDADRLDSMLFGARGKRVEEIQQVMLEVLMSDGTTQSMPVDQALATGVPEEQAGKALLNSILDDM
jgi:hypothetical protein